MGVRVSEAEEMQELDISEHGIQLALNAPTTFSSPSLRGPGVLATLGSRFWCCSSFGTTVRGVENGGS